MIFNMTGGGSASLNFKVTGGEEAPANPPDNTIWINTSDKITGWVFSATEPEEPTEGLVWITTGSASTSAFNALKKNSIMVYPLSAKQYIGGTWVDKTAKSWQDGEWRDWMVYLFRDGDEYESLTGGWKALIEIDSHGDATSNLTITNTGSVLQLAKTAKSWSIAYAAKKIDLTSFTAVSFEISKNSWIYGDSNAYIGIFDAITATAPTAYSLAAQASTAKDEAGTYSVDVSGLTGEYYIGFLMTSITESESFDIQISKVYLK